MIAQGKEIEATPDIREEADEIFVNLLENHLINEVLKASSDTTMEQWRACRKSFLRELERLRPLLDTHMCTCLAATICLIGARSTNRYDEAFAMLLPWEGIGGSYWIVQAELLRHKAVIMVMASCCIANADNNRLTLGVEKLFDSASHVTKRAILQETIAAMRQEFDQLIDGNPSDLKDRVIQFAEKYPEERFAPWAVDQLLPTLKAAIKRLQEPKTMLVMKASNEEDSCLEDTTDDQNQKKATERGPSCCAKVRMKRKLPVVASDSSNSNKKVSGLFCKVSALAYEDDSDESLGKGRAATRILRMDGIVAHLGDKLFNDQSDTASSLTTTSLTRRYKNKVSGEAAAHEAGADTDMGRPANNTVVSTDVTDTSSSSSATGDQNSLMERMGRALLRCF